jgi:hypothetical protein
MTRSELFKRLNDIHISKVYVMFSYENKEISIISNVIIMQDQSYVVDWGDDVYSDKSYIVEPIYKYDFQNYDSVDGLLTWDVLKNKVIISGEKKIFTLEKFSEEV